ncbi:hypothetical protein HDU90_003710 [Geranomyces variabilis]|nr:hypothetical protein HDU90_003710 [Geranomyces variabilis]
MPHSTASSPTTPASPASEPPSARTSSHPHTSLSSTAASPSSSSSFAPTTPPPATASHSSAYRQSPSLSPSISSTSAGASAAAAAGGGGTAPHTPPPVMRFQKNLALQKHQATMEDRRGHTVWMQKYRAVYEQVSREYASAKHWHDPFVLSLRRLNAPAYVSAAAAPPSIPADPTQTFHHNRLRATSLLHLHQPHLDPFSAGTGTAAGGGPDGHVVMTRTRSSGPSTSASGGSGGSGSHSGGHASALGGRRAQQQKSSQPAGPARASTVRGLSALLRGELPGTAVARSQ